MKETGDTEAVKASVPAPSSWAALAARRASPPPPPPRRPSVDGDTPTEDGGGGGGGGGTLKTAPDHSPALASLLSVPAHPPPAPRLGRRPLANAGNTCFMGATLQALLSLPPFAGLVAAAAGVGGGELRKKGAPVLASLADVGAALSLSGPSTATATPGDLLAGPALAVDCLLPTLARFGGAAARAAAAARATALAAAAGRGSHRPAARRAPPSSQEDAQEYLVHLLDAAHCELVALAGGQRAAAVTAAAVPTPSPSAANEDDGWVTAGRTRRDAAVTRGSVSVAGGATRVAAAFAGALRSEVRAGGGARPSATLQPFTVLSLDVADASVDCVEAALDAFVRPEGVEGYRPSPGAPPRRALKTLALADPPLCLVLHLCRFAYGSAAGSGKLHKRLPAPLELRLRAGWLARGGGSSDTSRHHRTYRLAATVSHHGASSGVGHYTAAVEGGDGGWLEFDDASVRRVRAEAVASDGGAYLLFYRAVD